MNKFLLVCGLCLSLFLAGCSSRPSYVPIYLGDSNDTGSTVYVNTTNNITNNLSMLINGSVACSGTDKLNNVTLSSNVLSGVCSADVSGSGSVPLYWGSFTYNYVLEDDMCGVLTTTGKDWYWTAIASGTTGVSTGYPTHPCVRRISSSTTASSGGAFNLGVTNLLLAGNESVDVIFSKIAKTGNISNVHMGFMDSVSATEPVDGVYIQIHDLTLNASVRTNNVEISSVSNFNISAGAWYRAKVEIVNTTQARFYLYNSTTATGTGDTVLLWSTILNVTLPSATSRQTGMGLTTWVSGSTTAVGLLDVDYMNLMINKTLIR